MKTNITTEIVEMSPAMADTILERNEQAIAEGKLVQRNISQIVVKRYAADMRSGHWLVTHQGIAMDAQGTLLDGRHRLFAIKHANVTVPIMVTKGLPVGKSNGLDMKTIDALDRGRPRSIAMQLQIAHGFDYATLRAAAARCIALLVVDASHISLSVFQTLEVLKVYSEGIDRLLAATPTKQMARGYIIGPMAMYHASKPKKAMVFANDFFYLTGLQLGSPALTLFKRFSGHDARGPAKNMIIKCRSTASALMAFDKDELFYRATGSKEAGDWLVELQKANADNLRQLLV